MTWSLLLANPRQTAPFAAITTATSRALSFNLQEPSTCAFTMPGDHYETALVDELITDTIWERDGVRLLRCRIGSSSDDISTETHETGFDGADYRSLLDRRHLLQAVSTTGAPGTGVEQATIVWDMITQTQAVSGGALGLTQWSGWANTGVSRRDVWARGTAIGQTITEMGQRRSVDGLLGFDWDIDADLKVRLWSPTRGTATGWSIQWGSNAYAVRRRISSSDYANSVWVQWTDKNSAEQLVNAFSSDLNIRPEGLWEQWEGGTYATTGEAVTGAKGRLSMMQGLVPTYDVDLIPGAWDPNLCWLGDSVGLLIESGRLSVNGLYRVMSINVKIGDDGEESVSVTLGTPGLSLSGRLWFLGRSVNDLERR